MKMQISETELLEYFTQSKYWPKTDWNMFVQTIKSLGFEIIYDDKENEHDTRKESAK